MSQKRNLVSSFVASIVYGVVFYFILYFKEEEVVWSEIILGAVVFFIAFFIVRNISDKMKSKSKAEEVVERE